jgi:hypothetical protein
MPILCPKCGSPNKYEEGINFACMMCGTRWPINGATPIIIKKEARDIDDADILKLTEGETMAIKARIRPCRNCDRTKAIQADGLCGSCNNAVYKKFTKGTPEYTAALAEAKKRVSDPNFRKGCRTAKPRPKVPDGGDPEMAEVIATMQMERERLLAKADKWAQAIELLQ